MGRIANTDGEQRILAKGGCGEDGPEERVLELDAHEVSHWLPAEAIPASLSSHPVPRWYRCLHNTTM